MKGILEFELPEEQIAFENASNGLLWRAIVQSVENRLQRMRDGGHNIGNADTMLDAVCDILQEEVETRNLTIWD